MPLIGDFVDMIAPVAPSTSGAEVFDEAALRAVQATSPLPPLPKSYAKDSLGIHLIVK